MILSNFLVSWIVSVRTACAYLQKITILIIYLLEKMIKTFPSSNQVAWLFSMWPVVGWAKQCINYHFIRPQPAPCWRAKSHDYPCLSYLEQLSCLRENWGMKSTAQYGCSLVLVSRWCSVEFQNHRPIHHPHCDSLHTQTHPLTYMHITTNSLVSEHGLNPYNGKEPFQLSISD